MSTILGSSSFSTPPVGAGASGSAGVTGLGAAGTAAVGLTPGSATGVLSVNNGNEFNYTLVIQVPVPILNINLNMLGNYVLAALSAIEVPAALQWLVANAETIFVDVVNIAMLLIKAIPEMTVSILVQVGPATVFNLQLVAKTVPYPVPVPTFALALPNVAVAAGVDLTALIPTPKPVVEYVVLPIPVPVLPGPLLTVTGGNVSVGAGVTTGLGTTAGGSASGAVTSGATSQATGASTAETGANTKIQPPVAFGTTIHLPVT